MICRKCGEPMQYYPLTSDGVRPIEAFWACECGECEMDTTDPDAAYDAMRDREELAKGAKP